MLAGLYDMNFSDDIGSRNIVICPFVPEFLFIPLNRSFLNLRSLMVRGLPFRIPSVCSNSFNNSIFIAFDDFHRNTVPKPTARFVATRGFIFRVRLFKIQLFANDFPYLLQKRIGRQLQRGVVAERVCEICNQP